MVLASLACKQLALDFSSRVASDFYFRVGSMERSQTGISENGKKVFRSLRNCFTNLDDLLKWHKLSPVPRLLSVVA